MGLIGPTTVEADTTVVPWVRLSERYDTNVFYAPQSFVPGETLWDFVTVVSPNVKVQHSGRSIEGDLTLGGSGNAYLNNPGLNYYSGNALLHLNLDNWINRLMPRARLQVSEIFTYTPEQPAFFTPRAESTASPYLIGIQAIRANSLINIATVNGAYDISPRLSVVTSYQNYILRFGKVFVTPGVNTVFGLTTQTAQAGPKFKLSPLDMVGMSYSYTKNDYAGDPTLGFEVHNLTAEYTRNLTPALVATMNAGPVLIQPGGLTNITGGVEFNWRLSEDERWMIRFTRGISAGFFIVTTALVGQRVDAGVVHEFTKRLTMTAGANYALNETTSSPTVRFVSYGTTFGLTYAITPVISTSLQHEYFNSALSGVSGFQGFEFDRNTVAFSITATWP